MPLLLQNLECRVCVCAIDLCVNVHVLFPLVVKQFEFLKALYKFPFIIISKFRITCDESTASLLEGRE